MDGTMTPAYPDGWLDSLVSGKHGRSFRDALRIAHTGHGLLYSNLPAIVETFALHLIQTVNTLFALTHTLHGIFSQIIVF